MEFTDLNELVVSTNNVTVYTSAETKGDILVSYKEGDFIYVTGISDEWVRVTYQGQDGYIAREELKNVDLSNDNSIENVDVAELDNEFEVNSQQLDTYVEEVQAQESYKKSNMLWIGAIVLLIAAIIIITIIERKIKRGNAAIEEDTNNISEETNDIDEEQEITGSEVDTTGFDDDTMGNFNDDFPEMIDLSDLPDVLDQSELPDVPEQSELPDLLDQSDLPEGENISDIEGLVDTKGTVNIAESVNTEETVEDEKSLEANNSPETDGQ